MSVRAGLQLDTEVPKSTHRSLVHKHAVHDHTTRSDLWSLHVTFSFMHFHKMHFKPFLSSFLISATTPAFLSTFLILPISTAELENLENVLESFSCVELALPPRVAAACSRRVGRAAASPPRCRRVVAALPPRTRRVGAAFPCYDVRYSPIVQYLFLLLPFSRVGTCILYVIIQTVMTYSVIASPTPCSFRSADAVYG